MLSNLLDEAARLAPKQEFVVTTTASTYAEIATRARRLAAGLRAASIERFACRIDDPTELVALLCAASAIGAEPCVYPKVEASELLSLAGDFDHRVIVVDGPTAIDGADEIDVVLAASLVADNECDLAATEESAPVLILTTGTTGRPKGARHDWNRLGRAASRRSSAAGSRWMLMYNLNQFAGHPDAPARPDQSGDARRPSAPIIRPKRWRRCAQAGDASSAQRRPSGGWPLVDWIPRRLLASESNRSRSGARRCRRRCRSGCASSFPQRASRRSTADRVREHGRHRCDAAGLPLPSSSAASPIPVGR